MPQIIVTANAGENTPVLLRERINASDFESELFARHLVERLGWAVADASELEADGMRELEAGGTSETEAEARGAEPSAAPDAQRSASVLTTAS